MDNRFGGILGLLILIVDILAIIEIFKSSKDLLAKILWTIFILMFPVIGVIIYYFFGRGGAKPLA